MASPVAVTAETLIILKVTHDGVNKRFKLPLRDLGINSLEQKLSAFLNIAPGTESLIERYSDSAAAFVVMDSKNVSAYKQLYRAAKAKQKLKFRVTTQKQPDVAENTRGPKPAFVEDEAEAEPEPEKVPQLISIDDDEMPVTNVPPALVHRPAQPSTGPVPKTSRSVHEFIMYNAELGRSAEFIDQVVADIANNDCFVDTVITNAARDQAAMQRELESIKASMLVMQTSRSSAENAQKPSFCAPSDVMPAPSTRPAFTVYCNSCDKTIPDAHFHCSTCDLGDFDLCGECVDQGITCYGDEHWLIKRYLKQNGEIVVSETERIAPRPKVECGREMNTCRELANADDATAPPAVKSEHSERMSHFTRGLAARAKYEDDLRAAMKSGRFVDISPETAVDRTCNSCVAELPESRFLHCVVCEDFDLCDQCFAQDKHGHHPKHSFVPVVEGTEFKPDVVRRLEAGRGQMHSAICDGCDKCIVGVRHKCLDCPDWDYCSDCLENAHFVHPNHRFVPIYEPVEHPTAVTARAIARPTHIGICCDGPLCIVKSNTSFISGDRFKCAVCHDTDFCANCEASPANTHNRTHPLIKFKTPVRHVSVTTTGDQHNGKQMPQMGDRPMRTKSRSTNTSKLGNTSSGVQTVVDLRPNAQTVVDACPDAQTVVDARPDAQTVADGRPDASITSAALEKLEQLVSACRVTVVDKMTEFKNGITANRDLVAKLQRTSMVRGPILPANHLFEQTWVIKNVGTVAWPAGCSLKFINGDYMGRVDAAHPASVSELEASSESTTCYAPLLPGEEFPFTVLLRTPNRIGCFISRWRLTTPGGWKFGGSFFCDFFVLRLDASTSDSTVVPEVKQEAEKSQEDETEQIKKEMEDAEKVAQEILKAFEQQEKEAKEIGEQSINQATPEKTSDSVMIFPKLEKESPVASICEEPKPEAHEPAAALGAELEDEFEQCDEDDEWAEDASEEGFMTDEEYDILDASDEETLEQQQQQQQQQQAAKK